MGRTVRSRWLQGRRPAGTIHALAGAGRSTRSATGCSARGLSELVRNAVRVSAIRAAFLRLRGAFGRRLHDPDADVLFSETPRFALRRHEEIHLAAFNPAASVLHGVLAGVFAGPGDVDLR